MAKQERGLGRGIEALFSVEENNTSEVAKIDIELVFPQENQPRKSFDPELLKELADSIREHGVLQPVLLRPISHGYEIIAGERRWRAAKMAGLEKLPALVREMDDAEVAEISLIENLQRDDLSVIEEAMAYRNLLEKHQYTQEKLAGKIGKSRTHITNTMRLLSLPPQVIDLIENKRIAPGHARALLGLSSPEAQLKAAQQIAKAKLSVRHTEELVRFEKDNQKAGTKKPAELADIEERLQKHLGTRTEINRKKQGGKIEITFYNEDDLERILELIGII